MATEPESGVLDRRRWTDPGRRARMAPMTVDTVDERRSKIPAEGAGGGDNQVTYQGVTYYLSENLPPLTFHVVTCPRCDGSGQMYGRKCPDCKGRGRLFPPVSNEQAGR